ncbi:MAG: tetratricopeptide repeat protein [bacterium]|nr:tetratricopeptide repeat protein [bacterium]
MHQIVSISMSSLLWVLVTLVPAWAETDAPTVANEGDRLFGFAAALVEEGDYYRAITEYKRFVSYFPDDHRVPLARLNVALAYRRGGKTDLAVGILKAIQIDYGGSSIAEKAHYETGHTYAVVGRHQEAATTLADYLVLYPDSVRRDSAWERLGWSLIHLWRLEEAAQAFQSVSNRSARYPFTQALAEQLSGPVTVPEKSPLLAGTLSAILPGAGQFYTQRPREGITSFVLNGSFIWAIAGLFNKGNEVAGVLLGFFETGWYSGGIFGAVNDAHKFNRKAKRDYIADLRNRYPMPREE